MQDMLQRVWTQIGDYAPQILGALAILVVGWIVAHIITAGVRAGLRKTKLDDKFRGWVSGDSNTGVDAADGIAKIFFYLIMICVLVMFFQALGLTMITEPLNAMLSQVFVYAPRLLGGLAILAAGWLVGTLVRAVVTRVLSTTRLDSSVSAQVYDEEGGSETRTVPLSATLGDALFWLVLLLFLPAALGALGMEGLLAPVQNLTNTILGYLPQIFAAGLLLVVGWFVARIVQRVVSNLLAAAGTDKLGDKMGFGSGAMRLSSLVGTIIYALILIPVLIAALNALDLQAVTDPASRMLNTILAALPSLFAATVLVAIAYFVGRIVSGLVANVLGGVGFDRLPVKLGVMREDAAAKHSPSSIAGTIVMVFLLFIGVTEAANMLGFTAVSNVADIFMSFGGKILFGLAIMAVGVFLANLAHGAIRASGTPNAALFSTVARVAVLVLVGAMALREMGFANSIIETAFSLLLGAIAVAAALAFGFGGRDWAASQLETWKKSSDR